MAFSTDHFSCHARTWTTGVGSTASLEDEYLAAEMEDIMRADLVDRALPWEDEEEYGDVILFDNNLDAFNHVRYVERWTFKYPFDYTDDAHFTVGWYPIAFYPSEFSHLSQLPNELKIQTLREMLTVREGPDMRVTAAQMLLRAGGNIVHLAALAKAIERQLVWVRAARSEQAEVDQLVVADEDKYTRLVERLCNWWNDGQLIVQATGRPTPMSLDLWRKNRTLLLLAKKLIEEGGVADAWLALNREVHEMQKVLKAICDQIQRPCTLPPPKERFFLEYYFVWMH